MTKTLNPKALREKIKFFPFPAQQEILSKMKRFSVICAGRRFSKSYLSAYLCLRESLLNNKTIWIVAPTYELSKRIFEYLTIWLNRYLDVGAKINNASLEIFIGSSKICCKSSESKEQLLGSGLDLLICDEASRIPKGIWESYLRPALSDKEGKAVFISTPIGKENWFHELYQRGLSGNPDWISFTFPSSANPYLSVKDLAEAKASLPEEVYQQEFEAKFLESNASVFRGLGKIIKEGILREPEELKSYAMGVDLGRAKDYSVLTIIDRSNHRVVFWDRFDGDWNFQKQRIFSIALKYNNAKVIIDSSGVGNPISQDLKEVGLFVEDFTFSNKSKKDLIEKLRIFVEQERISIPDEPILINELQSFGYLISPSGNIIYSAPQGQHDDCVISLALACWDLNYQEPLTDKDFLEVRALRNQAEKRREIRMRSSDAI